MKINPMLVDLIRDHYSDKIRVHNHEEIVEMLCKNGASYQEACTILWEYRVVWLTHPDLDKLLNKLFRNLL